MGCRATLGLAAAAATLGIAAPSAGAAGANYSLTPTSFDFGDVPPGGGSQAQSFTLKIDCFGPPCGEFFDTSIASGPDFPLTHD
jgi:hypothetical protein